MLIAATHPTTFCFRTVIFVSRIYSQLGHRVSRIIANRWVVVVLATSVFSTPAAAASLATCCRCHYNLLQFRFLFIYLSRSLAPRLLRLHSRRVGSLCRHCNLLLIPSPLLSVISVYYLSFPAHGRIVLLNDWN